MSKINIKVGNNQVEVEVGLTKADFFYSELGVNPEKQCLYLEKSGDIDIPLLPDDHIIIHGNETIVVGDINADIGNNPHVRDPVLFTFNGKKIEDGFERGKVISDEICSRDETLNLPRLFVDLEGKVDIFIKNGTSLVVQDTDSYFTIPASDDDSVDLEECSKGGHKPPKGQKLYKIKIGAEKYKVQQQQMTGSEILELVGKTYEEWSLNQKLHGGRRIPIESEAVVDFAEPGIERFETVMNQAQQG